MQNSPVSLGLYIFGFNQFDKETHIVKLKDHIYVHIQYTCLCLIMFARAYTEYSRD